MSGYIADTSVFIAAEQGRPLAAPPGGEARISVATLTELQLGVRRAEGELRELRETTLRRARRFVALTYDERVSGRLAEVLHVVRGAGRRADAMDAIIAATALAHDLGIWTQDADFTVFAELLPQLSLNPA